MAHRSFRILSLDGGGARGAFGAGFLAELERHLKFPVAHCFDLIAGTSTGGIIGAGLALGESASKIEDLYLSLGSSVFQRERTKRTGFMAQAVAATAARVLRQYGTRELDGSWLLNPKYTSEHLRRRLSEFFGARTLEIAQHRLLLPAVDLTKGQTVVFKTPHLPGLIRDRHMQVVDAVLATTAAPTYFPHANIKGASYCDGGIWANNPSLVAYAETIQIRERCKRPCLDPVFDVNDIRLLSIGTGRTAYSYDPPYGGGGIVFWGPLMMDLLGTSQSQAVDFQMRYILDQKYVRVDFLLPEKLWTLDRYEVIPKLIHLGHEAAIERYGEFYSAFALGTASPFHRFSE